MALFQDDFDHIQELVEHVCRNQKAVDSRNCNLAKVSAELLGAQVFRPCSESEVFAAVCTQLLGWRRMDPA